MLACYIFSVLWYIYSDFASEKPLLRSNHAKWFGVGIVGSVGHSVIAAQETSSKRYKSHFLAGKLFCGTIVLMAS